MKGAKRWMLRDCLIAKFINSFFAQVVMPPLAAAYFLMLDVRGDNLPIIADYPNFHNQAFMYLLLATLFAQAFKALADRFAPIGTESYYRFLEGFMTLTAKVVGVKLDRFQRAAASFPLKGDVFKHVTRPDAQVRYILDQSVFWLRDSFTLDEEQISITVLRIQNGGTKAYYPFKYPQNWQRTKAKKILGEHSSATKCLESGQPFFRPNKKKAAENNEYFMSERDFKDKEGSIYCYPIVVNLPGPIEKYVISVTTYGKCLCSTTDPAEEKIAERILREICHRMEIELTLMSIRQLRYGETSP